MIIGRKEEKKERRKEEAKIYLDAGTTYSKVIANSSYPELHSKSICNQKLNGNYYYIIYSKALRELNLKFNRACGHMTGLEQNENEIIALAQGCKNRVDKNATVLDLGSRDAKWIRFQDGKFHDMDWNTSCASSTGATVEMLMKFYDLKPENLEYNKEKFSVTCGIFGLEKIMDDISKGAKPKVAVAKFIHGIAYNAWTFAKNPEKLYLSGGFCENNCFVNSLKNYCEVELLGRFVLCEGLINE